MNTAPVQILLVEDYLDDVEVTVRALAGCKVKNELHIARDGAEALDFIFRRGQFGADTPRPDLVLVDINLPKESGIEVLSHIRGHADTSMIPVIMLTASSSPQDIAKSYRLGANTYVQKRSEFGAFAYTIDLLVRLSAVALVPAAAAS